MRWVKSFFIDNAKTYAKVLESQWKLGGDNAKLLSDLFKEKGLKRNAEVLDVPCGIGRITVPLAKLGYRAAGIDISPYFIEVAKKKAKRFGVARTTSFAIGKMMDVGRLFPEGHFDAALNIWTSIGYGPEKDDALFFEGLRKVVKKGGLFVIGRLANRDYLFSHFEENRYDETDDLIVLHKNALDVEHSKLKTNWKFYRKTGKSLRFDSQCNVELRLYAPHEVVKMLSATGWKTTAIYDSLTNKRPYSPNNLGVTLIVEAT
jgi:SAM-dependent methyltransferase